jgi:hypothetical protein
VGGPLLAVDAMSTRGKVAVILAAGLSVFISLSAATALVQQIRGGATPVSEGAQQLLALAIGGSVGVLAGYFSSDGK